MSFSNGADRLRVAILSVVKQRVYDLGGVFLDLTLRHQRFTLFIFEKA